MLGVVFTEFQELVRSRFSEDVLDDVLDRVQTTDDGAYTAVGRYPHGEMVSLVIATSELTGAAVDDLLLAFGRHLMARFSERYGGFFHHEDLFDFIEHVDGHIHREVAKLYPEARLPRVLVVARTPERLCIAYQSHRSMQMLAKGLLEGACEHYRTPCRIQMRPDPDAQAGGGWLFDVERL